MSDVAADVAAVAAFLAADTTDVLAADTTDVFSAAKAASGGSCPAIGIGPIGIGPIGIGQHDKSDDGNKLYPGRVYSRTLRQELELGAL